LPKFLVHYTIYPVFIMLLFQLFFLTIFSGSFPEFSKDSFFSFHSKEFFYTVDSDSVFVTKNGKSYEKWAHKTEWSHFDFNAINRPNEIILVSKGGGVLYRFKDNAFERLDTSFEHRNKYRSYDFTFENKIYSYGGYGLFNVNSNLTFFNELNREWSEFLYNPNSKTPSPRQLTIGQVKDSFLYIAGGSNKQVNEQLELNYNVLEDVWKLDLKTHFWTYLGTLNLDFFNSSNEVFSPATLSGSYKGGTLVIFKGKAIWFDIKNNRIKEFTNVNPILLDNIEFIDFNPDTNLFMFSKLIHDSQAYRFIFMTPSELLGNSVNEHPLYNSDIQYEFYLLSILLLVGIILVVYFKTKTKSSYSVILIHLNKIQKELSSEDFSVMKLILNEYPTAVDFPLILTFFEPNLSYESRVKKLRLSIGRIDKVLMVHTKSKVSILKFRKNKNDRRIKEVFLN
jgi:hypothetical protein